MTYPTRSELITRALELADILNKPNDLERLSHAAARKGLIELEGIAHRREFVWDDWPPCPVAPHTERKPMNKHALSSLLAGTAALGVLAAADGHERSYGAPRPSIGAVRKGVARRRAKQSQKKARRRNRK